MRNCFSKTGKHVIARKTQNDDFQKRRKTALQTMVTKLFPAWKPHIGVQDPKQGIQNYSSPVLESFSANQRGVNKVFSAAVQTLLEHTNTIGRTSITGLQRFVKRPALVWYAKREDCNGNVFIHKICRWIVDCIENVLSYLKRFIEANDGNAVKLRSMMTSLRQSSLQRLLIETCDITCANSWVKSMQSCKNTAC